MKEGHSDSAGHILDIYIIIQLPNPSPPIDTTVITNFKLFLSASPPIGPVSNI